MITNSEVAQTAQHLPSAATKLLNEARLELAIIIRDNIYQSNRLQDLLYTEIPVLVAKLEQAELDQCPDPELHVDGVEFVLAELVREEHDRSHSDPWPVCRVAICRVAFGLMKP
jgi:hypothetical protein